jgi:alpha-galactosidase
MQSHVNLKWLVLFTAAIFGLLAGCTGLFPPAATPTPIPTFTPSPIPLSAWDSLAATPPMGWNTFNYFGCDYDQAVIQEIADAMVSSGMQAAGYEYVILDDCWMAPERDEDGNLQPDPDKFPNGMQAVADYAHARGLKFGLYLDRGTATCAGYPGSYGYESQDAALLAAWGVDYIKYDNCSDVGKLIEDFTAMHDALQAAGRPIVFSMCTWGFPGTYFSDLDLVHLWRTTSDIQDTWSSMLKIMAANNSYASFAGPGHWNDPDMLEVGNGGMTQEEYRTHFTMWAFMAAPLIAGNDLRGMDPATLDILTAPEVIAIDQDPLGNQGKRLTRSGEDLQVWSKVLSGTDVRAAALLNLSEEAADITVSWSDLGLPAGAAAVRDLWARLDLGTFAEGYTANVPAHGVVLIKVVSTSELPPTITPKK